MTLAKEESVMVFESCKYEHFAVIWSKQEHIVVSRQFCAVLCTYCMRYFVTVIRLFFSHEQSNITLMEIVIAILIILQQYKIVTSLTLLIVTLTHALIMINAWYAQKADSRPVQNGFQFFHKSRAICVQRNQPRQEVTQRVKRDSGLFSK